MTPEQKAHLAKITEWSEEFDRKLKELEREIERLAKLFEA